MIVLQNSLKPLINVGQTYFDHHISIAHLIARLTKRFLPNANFEKMYRNKQENGYSLPFVSILFIKRGIMTTPMVASRIAKAIG